MIRVALAFAALLIPAAASAQTAREAAKVVMPANPEALKFQTDYGFADAIVTGDTIYLSGVVAGPAPTKADLPAAYEQAFARIADVLKRAGADWGDVVDITTFHTDLPGQIEAISTVKNKWVKAPFPTWTAIGISALYEPSAVTEIKVVAKVRPKGGVPK